MKAAVLSNYQFKASLSVFVDITRLLTKDAGVIDVAVAVALFE